MMARTPGSPHRRVNQQPLDGGIISDALRRTGDLPHPAVGAASSAQSSSAPRTSQVLLFDVDPDLSTAVPAAVLTRARHALRATAYDYESGPVTFAEPGSGTFALLVVAGGLTNETRVGAGGRIIELLLPGDLLSPRVPAFTLPEHEVRLRALSEGARLVALEQRFVEAAALWPGLMATIQQRLFDQTHRLAVHSAICQLPRIEDRVIAMLSHLAARVGKVTPEGVVIPLSLRHEDLASFVGARRPSVSLAIKMLRAQGRLARRADDTWVLPPAPAALAPVLDGS